MKQQTNQQHKKQTTTHNGRTLELQMKHQNITNQSIHQSIKYIYIAPFYEF